MKDKGFISFVKERGRNLIVPLCMIIFGLLFIFNPISTMSTITRIIGWIFIAMGVISILVQISVANIFSIGVGAIFLIVGLISVIDPIGMSTFIIKIFGFFMLVSAGVRLYEAYKLSDKSEHFLKVYAIGDIVTLILGFLLLFLSISVLKTIGVVLGIFLILSGIADVISGYKIYKFGCYVDGDNNVVWEE